MMKIFKNNERVSRPVGINPNQVTKVIKCDHFTLVFLADGTTAEVAESFEETIEKLNG